MSTNSRISLQHRLATVTAATAAMAGALAAPASATPSVGFCRVSVPVTISTPDTGGSELALRTPALGGGSVSCVGNLGSWMMAGQSGWSSVRGSLRTGKSPFAPTEGALYTGGRLQLWAQAPRYAWFHPPMVNFTSALQIHPVAGALIVTGSGRLIPTFKSPAHGSFTLAGVAKLVKRHARVQSNRRNRELLQLQFSVRNKTPR